MHPKDTLPVSIIDEGLVCVLLVSVPINSMKDVWLLVPTENILTDVIDWIKAYSEHNTKTSSVRSVLLSQLTLPRSQLRFTSMLTLGEGVSGAQALAAWMGVSYSCGGGASCN